RVRVGKRPVGLRDSATTGVVVTLVCRHDEECVVLGDAIVGQTVEEGGERVVIGLELRLIVGLPWPGGAWKVGIERRGKRRGVVVMSVGDVGVGHGHAGVLPLGDISEGVLGKV